MLNLADVYKKQETNWVSRLILDEVVIMPLCRSEEDIQYIYSIPNETGSRIWQFLDGKHSIQDIQEGLKLEYQGQAEVIEREVLEFIKDLLEAKLIKKSGQKRPEVHHPQSKAKGKKKAYQTPEIAEIKMQPEQAVLSCCVSSINHKIYAGSTLICSTAGCTTSFRNHCGIGWQWVFSYTMSSNWS